MEHRDILTIWKSASIRSRIGLVGGSAGVLLIIMLLFTIGFAPLGRMKEYQNLVNGDSLLMEEYKSAYDDPALGGLLREKVFTAAILELSGSDSIQLAVNLADSVVGLYLKGVKIHEIRVDHFRIDDFLVKAPGRQYVKLFSVPLKVQLQRATIVKEPIVVREAPRDPEEAALNAWEPDTLIQKPAFLKLSLEHGINLVFEQDKNPGLKNKWVRFIFRSRMRAHNLTEYAGNFFTMKRQRYNPSIVIRMPADELRAIYRALPRNAEVVVSYEKE